MHEKSPFSFTDLIQQRKRWFQGSLLVIQSNRIPLKNRLFVIFTVYSSILLPLTLIDIFKDTYGISSSKLFQELSLIQSGFYIYMFIFGALKQFPMNRFGLFKLMGLAFAAAIVSPMNLVIEIIVVSTTFFKKNYDFYVVKKDL